MTFYQSLFRPLLFRLDAEKAHNLAIDASAVVGRTPPLLSVVRKCLRAAPQPLLRTSFAGMTLNSPVALGAGFDKNGRALDVLSSIGYGAIEIGAVSMQPCKGNAGCRALRLVEEKAVLTRYGVPNEGVARVAPRFAERLRKIAVARHEGRIDPTPVGINIIWNSNDKPDSSIHEVVADMAAALQGFEGLVDYATLNFACPNIKGESHFSDIANVRLLFEAVAKRRPQVPVLLKFRHRPDLQWMDSLVELSAAYPWVKGFIPIAHVMRPMGQFAADGVTPLKGSISGAPLKNETLDIIRLWYSRIDRERLSLVATGGISTAQDAFDALAAGASLVQLFTTMIYNGPGVVGRINAELAELMRASNKTSVAHLIGSEAPMAEERIAGCVG